MNKLLTILFAPSTFAFFFALCLGMKPMLINERPVKSSSVDLEGEVANPAKSAVWSVVSSSLVTARRTAVRYAMKLRSVVATATRSRSL